MIYLVVNYPPIVRNCFKTRVEMKILEQQSDSTEL